MMTSPTGSRGIRVARARRLGGLRLHQRQGADAGDDRRGPSRGTGHCGYSSSAAIRPAQIISIRSQGTQCVGSPRSPSIRNPSFKQAARWTVRAGLSSGNRSARQASAAILRLRRARRAAGGPRLPPAACGQVPGARASHCMASVGCMPVTRQTRSRSVLRAPRSCSKITRRYRAGVVGMIGADSPADGSEHRNRVNDRAAARSSSRAAGRSSFGPSRRRPLRHREELADLDGETRQDVAAVEPHRGRQPGEVVGRRVDVDDPGLGPNVPDQADALLEILLELLVHLLAGVAPADDLDDQVGDEQGDRLVGNLAARQALPGDERHVGNPHQVDVELDRALFAGHDPQSSRIDEVAEERPRFTSDDGFLESHGLLHQDAVDQLVEPVFVVVEPVDVLDGPGARGWVLADALERDRAEPAVEVGDGPGLPLGAGNAC